MKSYLVAVASSLLLASMSSVEANHIVFGTFSGVLISSSGGYAFPGKVGDPVSGSFRYDRDLLTHIGYVSGSDPFLKFSVAVDGVWGISFSPDVEDGRVVHPASFGFSVDANGFPNEGTGASAFDVYIGPGGFIGFSSYGNGGAASVTYSIIGVADGGTTSLLLGVACGSLAIVRRRWR